MELDNMWRVFVSRRANRRFSHVERLESRLLLSGTGHFDHLLLDPPRSGGLEPAVHAGPIVSGTTRLDYTSPPSDAFTPAQIRAAYGVNSISLDSIVGDGTGETIAIVDAYDDPNFVSSTNSGFANSDLAVFDAQFGLPNPPSFTKVDLSNGTPDPAGPGNSNWEGEEALGRGVGPRDRTTNAKIILVEANSDSEADLLAPLKPLQQNPGSARCR